MNEFFFTVDTQSFRVNEAAALNLQLEPVNSAKCSEPFYLHINNEAESRLELTVFVTKARSAACLLFAMPGVH